MKIKKIVLIMLVLSVVVFGLSLSSFAADMGFHSYVNYWNGNFKTFNLSNKQSGIIAIVNENSEKIKEIQAELKSAMSDLEDLYAEKGEMTENNFMTSDINQQISSMEAIVNNYRDQLSYLESKDASVQGVFSAEEYRNFQIKVKGFAHRRGIFYKIRH